MPEEKTTLGFEVTVASTTMQQFFQDLVQKLQEANSAANINVNFNTGGQVTAGVGAGGAAQTVRNSTQAGTISGPSANVVQSDYRNSQLETQWNRQTYRGNAAAPLGSTPYAQQSRAVFEADIAAQKAARTAEEQEHRMNIMHDRALEENRRRDERIAKASGVADRKADAGIGRQQRDEAWLIMQRERGLKEMDANYAYLDRIQQQEDEDARKARIPWTDSNGKVTAGQLASRARQGAAVLNPMSPDNNFYTRGQQRYAAQAVVGLASHVIGGELGLYASNTALGEYNPMQAAGLMGAGFGGIMGGAAGFGIGAIAPVPQPGLGLLIGSQAGMTMGSAAAQAYMAPYMRTHSAAMTLASIAAREGRSPYDIYGAGRGVSVENKANGLQALSEQISFAGKSPAEILGIKAGIYTGTDIISGPQLAQTYATMGSALLHTGMDTGNARSMAKNLALTYGQAAPQMASMAAGVVSQIAANGDNRGDLMLSAGPEAFGAYADASGRQGYSREQLQAYGNVQHNDYDLRRADTQARGQGGRREALYAGRAATLAVFGTDTLAYAQAQAGRRQAQLQKFGEQDITAFDIPMAGMQAEESIHQALPYQPGYNYGLALERMGLRSKQLSTLGNRYNDLMKKGDLSEEQQLAMYSQYQGLRVNQAQDVAVLAEGGEDRAMLMSAGRPASFSRLDSEQMANLAEYNVGSPRRSHGAINGQQLAMQNNFLHQFDTADFNASFAASPRDRMSSMDSSLVLNYLARIADALDRGGNGNQSSTTRTGEIRGSVGAALSLQDITGTTPAHTN